MEEAPDRSEDDRERENRRMMELLNELRVALTGVQILFAFLLTVPFSQRFSQVTHFQRYTYFVTLLCAAMSVSLLIAPTAQHRVLFRRHQKHRLILRGTTYMLLGLGFLALAMTGVIMLITDVLFKTGTVVAVTTGVAVVFGALWYVIPLVRRLEIDPDEAPE
ncbi:MAG: hypothetical protein JOZ25_11825 [Actinobacteria bacterium]|nr:hypothetical protein [Actinomycetota bacterium]